jgi:hypothetical protein
VPEGVAGYVVCVTVVWVAGVITGYVAGLVTG